MPKKKDKPKRETLTLVVEGQRVQVSGHELRIDSVGRGDSIMLNGVNTSVNVPFGGKLADIFIEDCDTYGISKVDRRDPSNARVPYSRRRMTDYPNIGLGIDRHPIITTMAQCRASGQSDTAGKIYERDIDAAIKEWDEAHAELDRRKGFSARRMHKAMTSEVRAAIKQLQLRDSLTEYEGRFTKLWLAVAVGKACRDLLQRQLWERSEKLYTANFKAMRPVDLSNWFIS